MKAQLGMHDEQTSKEAPKVAPSIEEAPVTDRPASTKRKKNVWTEISAIEEAVISSYIDDASRPITVLTKRNNERVTIVLATNGHLQDELLDLEKQVEKLKNDRIAKMADVSNVGNHMRVTKDELNLVSQQLVEEREKRILEERRLREDLITLGDKIVTLDRERLRLEEARREEDKRSAYNDSIIKDLKGYVAQLVLQKAKFEVNDEFEVEERRGEAVVVRTSRPASSQKSHSADSPTSVRSRQASPKPIHT